MKFNNSSVLGFMCVKMLQKFNHARQILSHMRQNLSHDSQWDAMYLARFAITASADVLLSLGFFEAGIAARQTIWNLIWFCSQTVVVRGKGRLPLARNGGNADI